MPKHNDWLKHARKNLRAAEILLDDDPPLIGESLYFLQQSAEKALKAYLLFKKKPLRKTHDLLGLLDDCSQLDNEFEKLETALIDLNPYSTASRYPDDHYVDPDLTTAHIMLKKTEYILNFIESKIL